MAGRHAARKISPVGAKGEKAVINLIAAAAFFILLHRLLSGSRLRTGIVARTGERQFRAAFALASLAGIVWLGWAYTATPLIWRQHLWDVPSLAWYAQFLLQPLACLLIVAGLTSPNPGTVGQEERVERPGVVRGALRVTRHPFLWGIALLSIGHLVTVPSPRSLLLFGTLLVVALTGTMSIDAKRRARLGSRWTPFAAMTSNIPFGAILDGRQPLQLRELGVKLFASAAVLSMLSWLAHPAAWRLTSGD
jgi:uncharacterized membrane protein